MITNHISFRKTSTVLPKVTRTGIIYINVLPPKHKAIFRPLRLFTAFVFFYKPPAMFYLFLFMIGRNSHHVIKIIRKPYAIFQEPASEREHLTG